MECSIGIGLSAPCHKRSFVSVSSVDLLPESLKQIISLRTGIQKQLLTTICTHHMMQYNNYYSSRIMSCCNILGNHRKAIRGKLLTISMEDHRKFPQLIPGKKICYNCMKQLNTTSSESSSENNADRSFQPNLVAESDISNINEILVSSGISPIRSRRLSGTQVKRKISSKSEDVRHKIRNLANLSHQSSSSDATETKEEKFIEKLITAIQLKVSETDSIQEKIKILTVTPDYFTVQEIIDTFEVSEYVARKAKQLVSEKGILSVPDPSHRNESLKISDDIKADVVKFYENDESSRILPGKKDCISVKIDGEKVKKQKRLILFNLKELYLHWKESRTYELGFSFFASLRPPWCVLPGAAGTHIVCVCTLHQNPKLKLRAVTKEVSVSSLMVAGVCDEANRNCMMHECQDCPGKEQIEILIREICKENFDETEIIEFRQWVTTDRCTLKTIKESREEFIEHLTDDLYNLMSHHFISKAQSNYLNCLKSDLKPSQAVVQLDFSENFTCIQQESAQAAYYAKQQVTVHPYVVYFKRMGDDELKTQSFCTISDHLIHDSASVAIFNQKLLTILKNEFPWIRELHFFSDGSTAQYKNR